MGRGFGVSFAVALLALVSATPAGAADNTVPIRPGAITMVPMTPNVLIDSCDDGYPHAGPTKSNFYVRPEGSATQLGPTPSVRAIQGGNAAVRVRISPQTKPGTIILAGWTAVEKGCYSANGLTTYIVSLTAPTQPDAGAGGATGNGKPNANDRKKEDEGGGVNPFVFAAVAALAAAGLATTGAVVSTHRKANAKQKRQLESAVATASTRERDEQRVLAQREASTKETERLSREAHDALMKFAEEARGDATSQSVDARVEVTQDDLNEIGKKMTGPLEPFIEFVEKFAEKEGGVVASPAQVDALIQQRAEEIAKERGLPADLAEAEAYREYNSAGGALDRFADGVRGTREAVGDAAAETATETAAELVTKRAIKDVQTPKTP